MFEIESKDLISATRTLDFIRKLSPSNRRDKLIVSIEKWLSDSQDFDPKSLEPNIDSFRAEISLLITKISSIKSKFRSGSLTIDDFSF